MLLRIFRNFARKLSDKSFAQSFFLLFFAVIFAFSAPMNAFAMSAEQREIFDLGIPYYNVDTGDCGNVASTPLSDEQKIAATFMVGFSGNSTAGVKEAVEKYKLGGIYTVDSQKSDQNGYDRAFYDSLKTASGHTGFIISNDNEGGGIRRESFVFAESLQGMSDADLTAKVSAMASAMKNNGEDTNLAPVLDLTDVGASGRSFSADPAVVAAKAEIYARQQEAAGLKSTFKHFPGFDASVAGQNTDEEKVVLATSLADLKAKNIAPYETLLANHSGANLMLSNLYVSAIDGENPASVSEKVVDYVRDDLKFSGVIMTDSLTGPSHYAGDLPSLVAKALAAGVTMPMFEYSSDADLDAIIAAVKASPDAMANVQKSLDLRNVLGAAQTTSSATSGDLNGAAPTSLTGATNEEKVWNYFIQRGLTPIAAAGAMGNMQQEDASFDPFLDQGMGHTMDPNLTDKGIGLIQWTFSRRTNVINYLTSHGISPDIAYNDAMMADQENIDKALLLELNYLWYDEYNALQWQQQVNAEITVDGDSTRSIYDDQTGNGSALMFHSLVERSGDDSEMLKVRIENARGWLAKYGSMVQVSSCGAPEIPASGEGDIAATAEVLALPEKADASTEASDAYKSALAELSATDDNIRSCNENSGQRQGRVCALFVAVVMRKSGIDPNFGKGTDLTTGEALSNCLVPHQEKYMRQHPEMYQEIGVSSADNLQRGDIISSGGHIAIYLGDNKIADASYSDPWRTGSVGSYYNGFSLAFRFIGGKTQ